MIILKLENIFEWSENKRKIRFEAFVRGPEGIKLTVIELFTGSPAQNQKRRSRPVGLEPTIAWLEVRRLIH